MALWDVIHRSGGRPHGDGVVVLMLSLYLIILAFFILLNAIATPVEHKLSAALYSVHQGFDYREAGPRIGNDAARADGPVWVPRTSEKVRGMVVNIMPLLSEDVVAVSSDSVRVTLPAGDVWETDVLKPAAARLMENMLALVETEPDADLAVVLAGGDAGLRIPRLAALRAVAGSKPLRWETDGDGGLVLVLTSGVGVPAFAQRVKGMAEDHGAAVDVLGKEGVFDGGF